MSSLLNPALLWEACSGRRSSVARVTVSHFPGSYTSPIPPTGRVLGFGEKKSLDCFLFEAYQVRIHPFMRKETRTPTHLRQRYIEYSGGGTLILGSTSTFGLSFAFHQHHCQLTCERYTYLMLGSGPHPQPVQGGERSSFIWHRAGHLDVPVEGIRELFPTSRDNGVHSVEVLRERLVLLQYLGCHYLSLVDVRNDKGKLLMEVVVGRKRWMYRWFPTAYLYPGVAQNIDLFMTSDKGRWRCLA